ncbi:hypothetical protein AYO21_03881 [Fonsecaea monophora]|uniref:DUF7703 domain-containing protein n=1 Tax=Fonsecaea monophora TaxID=254056 RepID=A0A177FCL3_9EURO|nr:hypothetical protein AYO21_03881 [Fonsecaea monophora]OAG41878.1 hypothetical protein AYO21_03881 [Fonsecaea monophora]
MVGARVMLNAGGETWGRGEEDPWIPRSQGGDEPTEPLTNAQALVDFLQPAGAKYAYLSEATGRPIPLGAPFPTPIFFRKSLRSLLSPHDNKLLYLLPDSSNHKCQTPCFQDSSLLPPDMSSDNYYQNAVRKRPFDGQYTATSVIVTLSIALAFYNSLEMVLLILTTFKRKTGLYFWSLSICNYGVVSYTLGMTLSYFNICDFWLSGLLLDSGWLCMITCQSLVLYSRLGLILDNVNILRAVKWMIIVTSVFIGGPTVILDWGHAYSPNPKFAQAYFYVEHIQMTIITLQELIISGLYVWKTMVLLRVISKENTRSMIWQLLTINVMIICMDTALVMLQYKRLQLYQESIKGFVYSVKLKLELNILSKLVDLVQRDSMDRSMNLEIIDASSLAGQTQAAVRRESWIPDHLGSWASTTDKGVEKHMEEVYNSKAADTFPGSRPSDEVDGITRVFSQNSRYSARTARRESDILYAEVLRSMK